MASLSELVDYAKAQQPKDPFAEITGGFIKGATSGYEAGRERETKRRQQQFENSLKIIDANEKLLSIKQKQNEIAVQEDYLKSIGVLPYDDRENMIARSVAGEWLGDGKRPVTDNSVSGRIRGMFDKNKFGDYDMEVTMGPKGTEMKLTPKGQKNARTAGQQDEQQRAIIALAERMAQRDYLERLSGQTDEAGNPLFIPGVTNPNSFSTPTDLVEKWIPYAQDLYGGNVAGAKSKSAALRSDLDPLAGKKPKKKGLFETIKGAFGGGD